MDRKKEGGRRLKALREAAGLTLRELSGRTGGVVIPSRISNYEQGTRAIPPQFAVLFGNILGAEADYLLCIEEGSPKGDEEMTPEEHRILKAFRAMDEKDRHRALVHLEVMALPHRNPAPDPLPPPSVKRTRRPKATAKH